MIPWQDHLFLGYAFFALLIGVSSNVVTALVYLHHRHRWLQYYLCFHTIFTALMLYTVVANYFLLTAPGVVTTSLGISLIYLELLVALPLFTFLLPVVTATLCGKSQSRHEILLIVCIVGAVSLVNHVFLFSGSDWSLLVYLNDLCIIAAVGYSVVIGSRYAPRIKPLLQQHCARSFMWFLVVALGAYLFESVLKYFLFPPRIVPFIYIVMSVVMSIPLLKHGFSRTVWAAAAGNSDGDTSPADPLLISHQLDVSVLSDREQELLHLLAQGLQNADIAERLYISRGTVRTHLRNIYAKCGVSSRTELVALLAQKPPLSTDSLDDEDNASSRPSTTVPP